MAGNRSGAILPGRGTGSGGPVRAETDLVPAARNPRTAGRPEVDGELSGVRAAHPEMIVARSRETAAAGPGRPAEATRIVGRSARIADSAPIGAARNGQDRREIGVAGPAGPMIAVVSVPMIRAVGDPARVRAADVTKREASAIVAPGPAERSPIADIGNGAVSDLRTVPVPTTPATAGGVTAAGALNCGQIPKIAGSVPVAEPTAPTAEPAGVTRRARRRTPRVTEGRAARAAGVVRARPGERIGGRRVPTSRICPRTSRPVIWIPPSGAIC